MTVAGKLAARFTELNDEITLEQKRLCRLLSAVDRELSEKYHEIESKSFGVVDGYKHAKEIQDILKRRRAIKGECAQMNSLRSSIVYNEAVYLRACAKDAEIRASLNATMTLDDAIATEVAE